MCVHSCLPMAEFFWEDDLQLSADLMESVIQKNSKEFSE